jgi:hypothetical protein
MTAHTPHCKKPYTGFLHLARKQKIWSALKMHRDAPNRIKVETLVASHSNRLETLLDRDRCHIRGQLTRNLPRKRYLLEAGFAAR